MSKGISNFEIEKFFKEINNSDINENFVGVFPSDKTNKFIMFEKTIPGKKYPFIVSNTDRSDKSGTHWWSKQVFFFDSFGISGIKKFIVTGDQKNCRKGSQGKERKDDKLADRKDNKLSKIKLKFSMKFSTFLARHKIFFA